VTECDTTVAAPEVQIYAADVHLDSTAPLTSFFANWDVPPLPTSHGPFGGQVVYVSASAPQWYATPVAGAPALQQLGLTFAILERLTDQRYSGCCTPFFQSFFFCSCRMQFWPGFKSKQPEMGYPVLQPVLQFGERGPEWALQSWFVDARCVLARVRACVCV
jgi:hypothetical protein